MCPYSSVPILNIIMLLILRVENVSGYVMEFMETCALIVCSVMSIFKANCDRAVQSTKFGSCSLVYLK